MSTEVIETPIGGLLLRMEHLGNVMTVDKQLQSQGDSVYELQVNFF